MNFDLSRPIDISIPITENDPTNAFGLPPAEYKPFRAGSFVGSVEEGGPVRCDVVTLAPHGNGTHTECIGHIAGKKFTLIECLTQQLCIARLITVDLANLQSISRNALMKTWLSSGEPGLIIRTLPNEAEKRSRMWSGNNPPFISPDAMNLIVERGVQHLLVDMPSVDPEEDNGELLAHHIFWNWPNKPRAQCTITELIYVPKVVQDGRYMVSFNAAAFDGDAAPSRPVLYPEMVSRDETMLYGDAFNWDKSRNQ